MKTWLRKTICLSGATLPMACEMLEAAFGKTIEATNMETNGREPKRRRISESSWVGVLPALEASAKELLGAAALELVSNRFVD